MTRQDAPTKGFLFVALRRPHYFDLATRAAESIRRFHPDIAIDLYTDRPVDHPAFGRVIPHAEGAGPAKVAALLASRFDRTVYLDSDMLVTARIDDLFDVLDRFDIALTHDQFLANKYCAISYREPLPSAFPQFNGGLIALRQTGATQQFLEQWRAAIQDHDIGRDQPALRYTLWHSDLRIATLPPEYNLMNLDLIRAKPMDHCHAAPRIIHNPHFYQFHDVFKTRADPVADCLGLSRAARMRNLLRTDRTLVPGSGPRPRASVGQRLHYRAENAVWMCRHMIGQARFNMTYWRQRLANRKKLS